jgi:hypothetical protein
MSHKYTERDIERFWSHVDRSGGPDTCWLWTGALTSGRRGTMTFRRRREGVRYTILAHRMSVEIHGRVIPEGMFVCHHCPGGDQPHCVNPRHLWIGTRIQNAYDARLKGTFRSIVPSPGEANGRSILTANDVRTIRMRRSQGETYRCIAESYGRSIGTIRDICQRRSWRHI